VRWAEFVRALEDYRVGVRPERIATLGDKSDIWRTYLVDFHLTLHIEFAHRFIASLPPSGDLSSTTLRTKLEIVITADGSLDRVGVVETSGNTMFDFGAFRAVMLAAPYPIPPAQIRSPDGLTYLRWTLNRGESLCGVWNAEPYMLTPEAASAPDPNE
jgi:TonB family protein